MVRLLHVDAFTTARFTGNPATVILDAAQLDESTLLALAREFGHGDSAFVLPADAPDHDLRVRFFTPRGESAFIGHATLAVHAALHALDPVDRARTLRQKQKSGIVEVTTCAAPGMARFSIRQPPAPLGATIDPAALPPVLAALGLATVDLDARCPVQVAGSGSTRLLLGVNSGARLATLRPDYARLATLSTELGVAGFFVFSLRPAVPDCSTEARMFCPAIGIPEDPVSGNAHGMLGVYLVAHGLLPALAGRATFSGRQGHHMGRPGRVDVDMEVDSTTVRAVALGGAAVVVLDARLV